MMNVSVQLQPNSVHTYPANLRKAFIRSAHGHGAGTENFRCPGFCFIRPAGFAHVAGRIPAQGKFQFRCSRCRRSANQDVAGNKQSAHRKFSISIRFEHSAVQSNESGNGTANGKFFPCIRFGNITNQSNCSRRISANGILCLG